MTLHRESDKQEVIDAEDEMRGIRYVEREKAPGWLVGLATAILLGAIGAAWTANARLSSLEQSVIDLQKQVDRLEGLLAPRYRGEGGGNEPRHP